MSHTLPELPYAPNALEPHIDARTMEIHHGKHHQTYIDKLNGALASHDNLLSLPVEDLIKDISSLPADIQGAVRNNGGGHANHSFFWKSLSPTGDGAPSGSLLEAINDSFGDLDSLKSQFGQAALNRFGSGWAWLIKDSSGKLIVTSTPNQDSPLMVGIAESTGAPILGLDVWEHAYYLNYQNRRPDYVNAYWEIVNWDRALQIFSAS
jgi:Fe-Mn family superoxide dismutase